MEKGEMFRKSLHLCAPAFLLYYLVPPDMWGLLPTAHTPQFLGHPTGKEVVLILVMSSIIIVDVFRILGKKNLTIVREYEGMRLSAYSWAGIGITIALIFFPAHLVVPVIFGLGWTDPLIGFLRKRESRLYPALPAAIYFAICACSLTLYGGGGPIRISIISLFGAAAAILAEYPRLRRVDDDFLMQVVPLIAMYSVEYCLISLP